MLISIRKLVYYCMLLEFSKEKVVGTVTISINITESDIENILVTALEGGCDYWMDIKTTGEQWEDRPKGKDGVPISQWATKLMLEGKSVIVFDNEDPSKLMQLDLSMLMKGMELNRTNRAHDCDLDNMDVITADCIIQYALFGEIVYS